MSFPVNAAPSGSVGYIVIFEGGPAVYQLNTETNILHVYPNEKIFYSWNSSFEALRFYQAHERANYAEGEAMYYQPGYRLIKLPDDPKVYTVEEGQLLQHIPDEETAIALHGNNWINRLEVIDATEFGNFELGPQHNKKLILAQRRYNDPVSRNVITGTVVDTDTGVGIFGLTVMQNSSSYFTSTDADGDFILDFGVAYVDPDKAREITVAPSSGYSSITPQTAYLGDHLNFSLNSLYGGQDDVTQDPEVNPFYAEGIITDANTGEPIEGIQVIIGNVAGYNIPVSDSSGRFRLAIPNPGAYSDIYVVTSEKYYGSSTYHVRGGEYLEIELRPKQ